MSQLYDIRPPVPEDVNFILATWLRGMYYGDSWLSPMPKDLFMEKYKQIAHAILTNPNTRVRVACLPEDSNIILGYSVCSVNDEAVVWVFVKSAWRKKGIAKSLIPVSPKYVTSLTALAKHLLHKLPTAVYNPLY